MNDYLYAELIKELNLGAHLIINNRGKKIVEELIPSPDELISPKKARKIEVSFETPTKSPWKFFAAATESP